MDTYSFLRELADSWVLLAMFGFFAGSAIWAFWPGLSSARKDASMIPFRNDTPQKPCVEPCSDCKCGEQWKGKFDV
ncbi:cbb3-type cytochrome c oxidase subunit 3 [Planktotalea sp.]|uniref:cbb3-type cytochrome c oxidase subunit 3 n=1 Tax=Planktotalea sp. TaxID=2029877 RepID=UPI00329A7CD5